MYHKNYFEEGASHRGGLEERLDLLVKHVKNPYVLDVGCSGGYFDFGLMDKRDDIKTIYAMDKEPDLIDGCALTQRENMPNDVEANKFIFFVAQSLSDYIAFPSARVENGEANTCLYMSTHHHVIQKWGHEVAMFILQMLSLRFDQIIFDMGQKDEQGCDTYPWWNELPETENSKEWVRNYLLEYTGFDTVDCIGSTKVHGVDRWLFNLE